MQNYLKKKYFNEKQNQLKNEKFYKLVILEELDSLFEKRTLALIPA